MRSIAVRIAVVAELALGLQNTEGGELTPARAGAMESAIIFTGAFQRWITSVGTDGISYARLRLLEDLHCRGPQKMRALADELGLTPRNITDAVDALESEGLVRRTAHPTDRRATLVELTDAGIATAEQELLPRQCAIGDLFNDLSEAEQLRLSELLDRLADGLRRRGQRV
jgi:DNA-binding MarR family transcriptional regulator